MGGLSENGAGSTGKSGQETVIFVTAHVIADANQPPAPVPQAASRPVPTVSETRRIRLSYIQPTRAKQLLSPVFAVQRRRLAEEFDRRLAARTSGLMGDKIEDDKEATVTATSVNTDLRDVLAEIKQIDRVKRQVLLEARVVSMEKGHLLKLGAQCKWPTIQAGTFTTQAVTNVSTGTTTSGWPYGVQIGYGPDQAFTNSLMTALNLLVESGQAEVIANPRVVAQDAHRAEMRVVQEEWFMMAAPQTNPSYTQAQLQKIESGTVLTITPYVGDNNDITLQMAVEVTDSIRKARNSDLPVVTRRIAKNAITVKDGGTVAVAGLAESRNRADGQGTPILSDIPLLGELFKNKNGNASSRDVAVFVTRAHSTGHLSAPSINTAGRQDRGPGNIGGY